MELQFHPERVVFPADVRLLEGFSDAAERPRSGIEIAEEGGRFDGRTKALRFEDVAVVGITTKVGVHVSPDKRNIRETQEFRVGCHGGRPGATTVQPRGGMENQMLGECGEGFEARKSSGGLLGRQKFAGGAIVIGSVDG